MKECVLDIFSINIYSPLLWSCEKTCLRILAMEQGIPSMLTMVPGSCAIMVWLWTIPPWTHVFEQIVPHRWHVLECCWTYRMGRFTDKGGSLGIGLWGLEPGSMSTLSSLLPELSRHEQRSSPCHRAFPAVPSGGEPKQTPSLSCFCPVFLSQWCRKELIHMHKKYNMVSVVDPLGSCFYPGICTLVKSLEICILEISDIKLFFWR